jgi:hypothetical protein
LVSHNKNKRKKHLRNIDISQQIAQKSSQEQFEDCMTWVPYESSSQSVRPSPSSQIAVMSFHDYPMIASTPNSECRSVYDNLPRIWVNPHAKSAS